MNTKTPKQIHATVHVPIQFQIVETVTEHMKVSLHGEESIGHTIDHLCEDIFRDGREIGKITIDLSEFSAAFIRKT